MIAEIGSAPGPARRVGGGPLAAARADGVDALVWFEFDKETDWRLAEIRRSPKSRSRRAGQARLASGRRPRRRRARRARYFQRRAAPARYWA